MKGSVEYKVSVLLPSTGQEKPGVVNLSCSEEMRMTTVKKRVAEMTGLKDFQLVLFDAKPPREVDMKGNVGSTIRSLTQVNVLRLEARLASQPRSWSQVLTQGKKTPPPPPTSSPHQGGLLRVNVAQENKEDHHDAVVAAPGPAGLKEEGQKKKSSAKSRIPKPTEKILLSDLISKQLAENQQKEQKKTKEDGGGKKKGGKSEMGKKKKLDSIRTNPNPADRTSNLQLRGKERLVPKKKKPTKLKMIIEAERKRGEEGKKERDEEENGGKAVEVEEKDEREEESVESEEGGESVELKDDDEDDDGDVVVEEDPNDKREDFILIERPFAAIDLAQRSETELEMNRKIIFFLSELRRFQARLFAKNPDKARAKRRVLHGLREVERAARRNSLRCAVVAPNVEDIKSKGGLNDLQQLIAQHCQKNNIPLLVCMTRASLGKAVGKQHPVAAVGVASHEGGAHLWKEIWAMYAIVAKERENRKVEQQQPREEVAAPAAPAAPVVAAVESKPKLRIDAPSFVPRTQVDGK